MDIMGQNCDIYRICSHKLTQNCFGFRSILACNGATMKHLSDIGEDALIQRLLGQLAHTGSADGHTGHIIVGPGDDCAVVDTGRRGQFQLLKTDAMVEGVHFLPGTAAAKVGWKAVARTLSDFAAMGGLPGDLLVTVAMPASKPVSYMEKLYQGMQKCAGAYGAVICGGETTSVPEGSAAVISVAGTGWVEKARCITRSGGRVGDRILVTGKLGGSIRGKHLSFVPRLEEARWLTEHFRIRSMMDISDGLGRDLSRLAAASGCGFHIDQQSLPRNRACSTAQALGDGEDYELLLTVSATTAAKLCEAWRKHFPKLALTEIGQLTGGQADTGLEESGWQHFAS